VRAAIALERQGAHVELRLQDDSAPLPALEPDEEPVGRSGRPPWPGLAAIASNLDQASRTGEQALVDLDGEARPAARAGPGARNVPSTQSGPADPSPARPTGPADDEALELDFEKAGLKPGSRGMVAPGRTPPASSGPDHRPDRVATSSVPGSVATSGGARPTGAEASISASRSLLRSPAPRPERIGLLGSDPVSAALRATAIALALGLVPAFEVTRRGERDRVLPLEDELVQVVERPLAARAGTVRTSKAVLDEVAALYGDLRSSFLLMWLGVAIPLGLALFWIRRPGG
jgi:hypothetical protein